MDKNAILRRFCDLAKIDSAQRIAEWLASLCPNELKEAKEQIEYYLPRESLAGLNEIGAYILSLPDDEINHLVLAKLTDGPGLSCNLVSFLIKYDPARVERLYRNWVGQSIDIKGYCHIESDLVAHGYLDALPALEMKASKVSNGNVAIALAKQLYQRDPHKYQKLAIKVASKAMKDSWHAPSGCEWLIDLQGEAALPTVIARLRKPVDCSVMGVARHAVTSLGLKAEPLMEFALKEDDNSLVLGVAQGIVQAQLPTEYPVANKVFEHLIENSQDAWLMNIMEQLGRWNPSLLLSHSKRFLSSPDANIRTFFQNAVKGLPKESSTVAPPDSDSEFQQRLIDTIPLNYQAFVKAEATPCLCLQTTKATAPIPRTHSKMGGLPDVPDDFVWPFDESGLAFTFVARLAESDIQRIDPAFHGSLLFFADIDHCRSSGAVIHLPPSVELKPASVPGTLYRDLAECQMEIFVSRSLPDHTDACDAWRFPTKMLSDAQVMQSLKNLRCASLGMDEQYPMATSFGHPHFCQGNPKFSAEQRFTQLGSITCMEEVRPEFYRNTKRWFSLFSSWTNDKARLTFYDTGTICFLITENEYRLRDFSKVEVNIDFL